MQHKLIDDFCDAIEKWAEITQHHAENITFWAMIDLGAPWFVKAEGAADNPSSPEHRHKTVGEVHGRYTVAQLRQYLIFVTEELKMFEDFIIVGLAQSIERHLNELVIDYDASLQRTRDEAAKLQDIYDHPDSHREFLEIYKQLSSQSGFGDTSPRESVLHVANMFWRVSHRVPDELAQRQSMLAAWKTVVDPAISRESLKKWREQYFNDLGME